MRVRRSARESRWLVAGCVVAMLLLLLCFTSVPSLSNGSEGGSHGLRSGTKDRSTRPTGANKKDEIDSNTNNESGKLPVDAATEAMDSSVQLVSKLNELTSLLDEKESELDGLRKAAAVAQKQMDQHRESGESALKAMQEQLEEAKKHIQDLKNSQPPSLHPTPTPLPNPGQETTTASTLPKIAFVIVMHKELNQVARLVRALWSPDDVIVIHKDRKAPFELEDDPLMSEYLKKPNVFAVGQNQRVIYGGPSRLEADVLAIRELLNGGCEWDYFLNLSGQDFPVRPILELKQFLASYPPKSNFVSMSHGGPYASLPEEDYHKTARIDQVFYENDEEIVFTQASRTALDKPKGIDFWFGNSYLTLSRDFCETMFTSPLLLDLLMFSMSCWSPDEMYWVTALMNSPFQDTVVDNNFRFIEWSMDNCSTLEEMQAWFGVGYTLPGTPHPCVLGEKEVASAIKSGSFFANKFDPNIPSSMKALAAIEHALGVAG